MGYREPEMALTQARRRWTSSGKIIAILSVFGLILSGCGKGSKPVAKVAPAAPIDPWVITNLDPNVETPALLWNGTIGIRFRPTGERQIFLAENYEKTGEEKIRKWSNENATVFWVGEEKLDPRQSSDFKETLDLVQGRYNVSWSQQTANGGLVKVEGSILVNKSRAFLGESWSFSSQRDCQLRASYFSGKPQSPGPTKQDVGCDNQYWVDANGLTLTVRERGPEEGAWNAAADNCFQTKLVGGQEGIFFERVAFSDPELDLVNVDFDSLGKDAEMVGPYTGNLLTGEMTYGHIDIDGPVEDQQAINSFLYYLQTGITDKMSISPMGLSSDIYNGHVFWDADIWVFPALALIDPERAEAIPDYRLKHLAQANRNYQEWLKAGRPTGKGNMGSEDYATSKWYTAAKFPWESSITGKETVPGPSRYQDHITGSVVWSTQQASSLGLISDVKAKELLAMAAGFYGLRSHKVGNLREIHNTMSPDEHHTGDNDLYTNLLAMWVTNNGKWPAKPTYKLPQDPATQQPSNQATPTFLTYDNDGLRGYKQAAAVLSIYPLQYPPAEKQARQMMERFADKVTKNGPAMTDSIHSIIWSRLGEKDKAYKTWHDSWKPFVKPPFLLFSEKRNSSRTYFTTGAAGSLQAVLYGFAGLRIDNKKAPNAQWSIPLKNGQILSIAPNLPREWKKLTLRNLTILGKRYTFEIEGNKVVVLPTK